MKKRDGRLIPFNPEKITRAISLAASEVANKEGITADYQIASELTEEVRKLPILSSLNLLILLALTIFILPQTKAESDGYRSVMYRIADK